MTGSSSDLIQLRMKLIGDRVVVSGTDKVSKSVKGLGKATTETSAKQRYAERTNSRLTTSYKKLGTAAKWGLGFLGVGGVMAIHSSIAATEELGKTTSALTRNFGLQNNVASRWAALAQARGIDSKALSMTFGTLSTKLVEAGRKGGTALTPFHQLGISQEELVAHANDTEWALLRVGKALGDEAGGAKRSAAAKALLGKGFSTLLPLFSEGTKGLKEQLHWADKYGVTLSGSTTDGIMEMVSAQRENKVAMLGLQVSLTKALMPAIHAGDEELQKFIATLNSPDLTAEQKMNRISNQFVGLEDEIVKVIDRALPKVAENAGHLGIAMARAMWHGFIHSNLMGKLAISAWLFSMLGGQQLVMAGAKKVGVRIGGKIAAGIALGIVGYELWSKISQNTKDDVFEWAYNAGVDFVNFFVSKAEDGFDALNFLSWAGVDAPNFGHLEHLGEGAIGGGPAAPPAFNPNIPHGTFVPPGPEINRHRHAGHRHATSPRVATTRRRELILAPQAGGGGSSPRIVRHVTHIHVEMDGRQVAETVTEHALDDAARK